MPHCVDQLFSFVRLSNYPKTLSSPGLYGGYTPFSDSYLVVMDASQGFSRRRPGLFILWPGLFILEGPAVQDHRGSVMVDFPHLELFYGVGRGGNCHHQPPVIAGVISVNVLQLLHKIRQHGGHPDTPLVSCRLFGRFWTESISPDKKNLSLPGNKSSEFRLRKRAIIP